MSVAVTEEKTGGLQRVMQRASNLKTWHVWLMVFCSALLLYGSTCQTSPSWQDSGNFQLRMLTVDYWGALGLVVSHPVLIFLGQVAKRVPLGDLLWRFNAISAVGMAVALANFMGLIALLTHKRWLGVLFAGILGLSHITWWLATITETYTWVVAGLIAELWLFVHLVRRPDGRVLTLLGLLNGLGLSLHAFAILALPVYAITAVILVGRRQLPAWSLGTALMAYLIGAGPYIGMMASLAVSTGDPMGAIMSAFFAGGYDAVTNTSLISANTKANAALASLSFANIVLPLALVGWIRFRKSLGTFLALTLGGITFLHVLFIIRYNSPDQFTSMLPAFVMVVMGAAVGANTLVDRSATGKRVVIAAGLVSMIAMPILYGTLPGLLRSAGMEITRTRLLPFRDEARYWITPWKQNEDSALLFAEAACAEAFPDGVIFTDPTPFYPLLVTRTLNQRFRGITLHHHARPLPSYDRDPQAFKAAVGDRPLFVVSPLPGYLMDGERMLDDASFTRQPGHVLYTVTWKNGTRDANH